MARFIKNRTPAQGLPPGSLVFMGSRKMEKPRIRVIEYNNEELEEKELETISEAFDMLSGDNVTWLNIDGLHDTDLISELGKKFNIFSLALEDILNTDHRPKILEEENNIAIITKALTINQKQHVTVDQVSFVLGKNYLISLQESVGTFFEPVRERIRNSLGRIRSSGADYLCYALMDSLVDNYLITLHALGERIESLEDRLGETSDKNVIREIYFNKKETVTLRKQTIPVREQIASLLRSESPLIEKSTRPYLSDLEDLVKQAVETSELYYQMVNDQLNLYQTNVSNGVNDVMKVLTIFSSLFIPMTFIAGLYGTNFPFIPEFSFRYSYFVFLGVMIVIGVIMFSYFKRKKWL